MLKKSSKGVKRGGGGQCGWLMGAYLTEKQLFIYLGEKLVLQIGQGAHHS